MTIPNLDGNSTYDCPFPMLHFKVEIGDWISMAMAIVLNALGVVFSSVANSLVLVAIGSKSLLHTNSNYFIVSLAATDVLTGLFVQPLFLCYHIQLLKGDKSCAVDIMFSISQDIVSLVSATLTLFVSVDRYLNVMIPFKYRVWVNGRYITVVVIATWVFWSVVMIGSRLIELSARYRIILVSGSYFVCFALVVLAYCQLFRVANRHRSAIVAQQNVQRKNTESKRKFAQANRSLFTSVWVVGTFCVCYMPKIVGFAVYAAIVPEAVTRTRFMVWINTVLFLNSSINPLVYCWKNIDIRKNILEIICVKKHVNVLVEQKVPARQANISLRPTA